MASTPWHLLTSSATIMVTPWTTDPSGIPYGDDPTSNPVIACMMQPLSANDALAYGRDTTTEVYDLFLAPTTTTGIAWDCSPKDQITVDSVSYRIAGKPKNLCNLGVLKHLVIEKDTN
jgi:hypothetical protein